jgi:hypothetical protein
MSNICGLAGDEQQDHVRITGSLTFRGSNSRKYLDNKLSQDGDGTLGVIMYLLDKVLGSRA